MMESRIERIGAWTCSGLVGRARHFHHHQAKSDNGHKGGFSFVAGVWVSDILLVMLSNTLTALVSAVQEHSNSIAYGGGGFLIAMGIYFVFFKKAVISGETVGGRAAVSETGYGPDLCLWLYHQYP